MAVNRTTLVPADTPQSRRTSTVLAWILPHLFAHVASCGYDATPLRRLPGLAGRDPDDHPMSTSWPPILQAPVPLARPGDRQKKRAVFDGFDLVRQ